MKRVLIATAALEAPTGIALLLAPAFVVALLLGVRLDTAAAATLGRITGAALLGIGLACWAARDDGPSRGVRGLVAGMLLYDVAVVVLLLQAWIATASAGPFFWPAILAHSALTFGSLAALRGSNHTAP